MLSKALVSVVLIVVVVGAGAAIAAVLTRTAPKPAEVQSSLPPPLVRTVKVEPETITEMIIGYGSARPYRSVVLAAEVAGEVVEVGEDLQDGSVVQAGQLLVQIDERRYQQALEQRLAQAEAEQAGLSQIDIEEANLRRLLEIARREVQIRHDEERRLAGLLEDGHAPQTEYNLARLAYDRLLSEEVNLSNQLDLLAPKRRKAAAACQSRAADVELAKLDLEYCRITAPFDGQIDELKVELGETVQRGTPIASVIDPQRIEAPVELPVSARPRVKVGADVRLWVDSMPELRWSGVVERVSPDADERSRTFRAYIVVDNRKQDQPLLAGYFLRAEVVGPTLTDVLLVPRGAIVEDRVLVAEGNRVAFRKINLERFLAERAVVTGELQPGDRVIVTNLDLLEEGMNVRRRNAETQNHENAETPEPNVPDSPP